MTMTKSDETYNALKGFRDAMGFMPTVRELGALLGLSSPDSVRQRLVALEREGRIERVPGSPRAIILKEV